MGNADLTDGIWVWPEDLAVYVERFHVRLPDELVAHARRNRFVVPPVPNADTLMRLEGDYDFAFWQEWATGRMGTGTLLELSCDRQRSKSPP